MTFLELTLSGTVMILAAAVFRRLTFRRLPKGTFVALWWVAALRLLVPVTLPSRFSVYTLLESLRPQPEAPVITAPPPSAAPPVVIIPAQTVPAPAPVPEPFPVWTALWITVAAMMALWSLARYVRWRRRFRESLPVGNCFDTCLRSRRRVQLRITDQITAPLTYGLLRPVILLPKTLDLSDEEAVACVLAHEMAHVRRLDSLFKLVLTAALCLHWFNPAVWLLYVLANRDMELRCDEAAVLSLGEDSREKYALALIRMAELRSECVPLCGFSQKNGMEERIKAIMSIKKQSMLACLLALAMVLGITTAFATSAKPEDAPKRREEVLSDDARTVQELAGSVSYDSGNVYFTIPESDGLWSIWISGRLVTEDGMGMSVHYLAEESEKGEWVPRMTYSFEAADAAYDELAMDIKYGDADYHYDLTLLLPEGGAPMASPLEWKERVDAGVAMTWPVDGGRITNSFGERSAPGGESSTSHSGVDIGGVKEGAPIYAAASGTVKATGFSAQQGNYIQLDHGNGLETVYAHCRSIEVQTGASVEIGQTIATVGSTGMSTGPHLHFGILLNGEAQNPELYFRQGAPVGPVGQEDNTDLPAGTPEVRLDDEPQSAAAPQADAASVDPNSDAAKYYAARDLPKFQYAFSKLSEKEQEAWLYKLYADGEQWSAYFELAVSHLKTDSALIKSFAEKAYQDNATSFFSLLENRMSEKTLKSWLERAEKDKKTAFQSLLQGKLNAGDPQNPSEKEQADQQMKEYEKFDISWIAGQYFYKGKLLRVFLDQYDDSSYFLETNPEGEACIKTIRNASGQLTGVANMTDAEIEQYFGKSFQQEPAGKSAQREELVNGDYPTNDQGETYGNSFGYDLTGHEPDLMAAVGTNGESGYISMEESQLSWSPNRDEIIAYQNWKEENHVTGYTIPLYDKDHNVIGEFQVGEGGAGSKTFEEMKAAKAQGWPNSKGSTLAG